MRAFTFLVVLAAYAVNIIAIPYFKFNFSLNVAHRGVSNANLSHHKHHHHNESKLSPRTDFPTLNVSPDRYEPCPGFPTKQRYNATHTKEWHFHCWCYKYDVITCDMPWAYGWGSGQYQGENGRGADNGLCEVKAWWGCKRRHQPIFAHNMGLNGDEHRPDIKNIVPPVNPWTCTGACQGTSGAKMLRRFLEIVRA
ncbi:hypothetical protein BP5796_08942 [Coleophoma crateriformis]|uniref:Uncharacterized protein n=1 Tax=Coleophoma crateriformis TaxID=565419 RepID=A0A3D8R2K7_9HELO|nr:hypothetical protein BP5796_08942 [Coleophoma crateriformis]